MGSTLRCPSHPSNKVLETSTGIVASSSATTNRQAHRTCPMWSRELNLSLSHLAPPFENCQAVGHQFALARLAPRPPEPVIGKAQDVTALPAPIAHERWTSGGPLVLAPPIEVQQALPGAGPMRRDRHMAAQHLAVDRDGGGANEVVRRSRGCRTRSSVRVRLRDSRRWVRHQDCAGCRSVPIGSKRWPCINAQGDFQ